MQKARQKAKAFREENILPFPVEFEDLQQLALKKKWFLYPYSKAAGLIEEYNLQKYVDEKKAFTYTHEGEVLILFDDNISYTDKIFCICHEIGHIEMRHTCLDGIFGKERDGKRQNILEQEADVFALDMIAPPYLLFKNGFTSVKSIVENGILNERYAIRQLETCLSNSENPSKKRHRKQLAAVLLSLTIISGIGFAVYQNAEASQTVYITRTGARYHIEECYHLKGREYFPVTLQEAVNKNLTPCKDCIE